MPQTWIGGSPTKFPKLPSPSFQAFQIPRTWSDWMQWPPSKQHWKVVVSERAGANEIMRKRLHLAIDYAEGENEEKLEARRQKRGQHALVLKEACPVSPVKSPGGSGLEDVEMRWSEGGVMGTIHGSHEQATEATLQEISSQLTQSRLRHYEKKLKSHQSGFPIRPPFLNASASRPEREMQAATILLGFCFEQRKRSDMIDKMLAAHSEFGGHRLLCVRKRSHEKWTGKAKECPKAIQPSTNMYWIVKAIKAKKDIKIQETGPANRHPYRALQPIQRALKYSFLFLGILAQRNEGTVASESDRLGYLLSSPRHWYLEFGKLGLGLCGDGVIHAALTVKRFLGFLELGLGNANGTNWSNDLRATCSAEMCNLVVGPEGSAL
ncbi:uncharacterized protein BDR25DRAFT_358367 [Lindgomyces ingoldianus]|uniref:Uncharacterized protein n=1 Tax=Lindgomyces ingoldianus TaxID=673940 RepID=A0ACB6QL68_9PLEO|nr:uncharacterized protein BDR25DRAFT_358367 [Lindgomyces ingoldianus]KAF2467688.1 hypothetical protein BDR25DRAFT_358367 [Lindgomyces ingoldianus]